MHKQVLAGARETEQKTWALPVGVHGIIDNTRLDTCKVKLAVRKMLREVGGGSWEGSQFHYEFWNL